MSKKRYTYRVTYDVVGNPHSDDADTPAIWRFHGVNTTVSGRYPPYDECDVFYMNEGEKHRDNGEPASIYSNGSVMWYINGKKHRDTEDNYPAYIKYGMDEVTKKHTWEFRWYVNGKKDRKNEPAVIRSDGIVKWYRKDKLLKRGVWDEEELREFMTVKGYVYECSYG